MINVNDSIRIVGCKENDPNGVGRVVKIVEGGVLITNMNMPYMGTYVNHFVPTEMIAGTEK